MTRAALAQRLRDARAAVHAIRSSVEDDVEANRIFGTATGSALAAMRIQLLGEANVALTLALAELETSALGVDDAPVRRDAGAWLEEALLEMRREARDGRRCGQCFARFTSPATGAERRCGLCLHEGP